MANRLLAIVLAAGRLLTSRGDGDDGYELLFEDALDEFEDRCVEVSTPFPEWAQGDFIIPSIARTSLGDRRFVGELDPFGKLQRFEMKAGEVCATYRIMATGFYNASPKANTIGPGLLFFETDPPRHCPLYNPICNMPPFAPNDNTFVNTIRFADKLLSITDSPAMLEVDPRSMNVTGTFQFTDKLAGTVSYTSSAHPVKKPGTEVWIDFLGNAEIFGSGATIRVFNLSSDEPHNRKGLHDVKMDHSPYMHSFGVTSRHVVLPIMPIEFSAISVATKPMHSAFSDVVVTEEGPSNAFHIVPLDGSDVIVKTLPVDQKLYYVHNVNTYENASGIVIDLTTLPGNPFASPTLTIDVQKTKAMRDGAAGTGVVRRFLLPLDDKPVTSEVISDPKTNTDFTKTNPRYAGRGHCFYWGVQWYTDPKVYGTMAIVKYDLCGAGGAAAGLGAGNPPAKLQWTQASWFPSEPTMIPSQKEGAAEDEGILVFTALDGMTNEAHLMVLNAASMKVISQVGPFPRIAFTTHGEFYPRGSWSTMVHQKETMQLQV